MNGILQFVQADGVLTAIAQADLIAQLTQYAGEETAAGEHVLEAYQLLRTKAGELALEDPAQTTYYYYWNNDPSKVAIIVGAPGMNSANEIQPQYARLDLQLNGDGTIKSVDECYLSRFAFPPASPFTPQFCFSDAG
jgi:hypothetical protein